MSVFAKKSNIKLLMSILIAFLILILFISLFFQTHFYPGTRINGVKVGFMNTAAANKVMEKAASEYSLVLKGRDEVKEVIKGAEIGLVPDSDRDCAILKEEQNHTFWGFSFWNEEALFFDDAFTFDDALLMKRFENLRYLDESRVTPPKNATLRYSNGTYEIIKEIYGNQVNQGLFLFALKNTVKDGITTLNLEDKKCYVNPEILYDSEKITNVKAQAESYLKSKVIYQHWDGSEIVDEEEISQWIEFDDKLNILFNHDKIKDFLKGMAAHYDTLGKEREFVTANGRTVMIKGGDFGWKLDIKGETKELAEAIVRGDTVYKEPKFLQRGAISSHNDIGKTYIEIDLSRQYLWYFDEGVVVVQGAVVTGKVRGGYKTPDGVYSLKYKIKNAVLKGHDYRVGVSYWMPFNNDIGIHDAPWRTEFGRDIYLTRGSHGCINASFYLAKTLFENVEVGVPVVCYY